MCELREEGSEEVHSRCLIKVVTEEMGSGNGFYSTSEFNLDAKWLIDPKHLFVGPKIGEGAHAKVYEGKYVFFFLMSIAFFFFFLCLSEIRYIKGLSVTLSLFLNSLSFSLFSDTKIRLWLSKWWVKEILLRGWPEEKPGLQERLQCCPKCDTRT